MARTIRWGIIGCGDVTESKSGPAFQKARDSSLVAVMRRTGALARDYAQRHGVPRWYDDAEALIGDKEVDAVYIATPPAAHACLAMACARAGKPAYVEKPMALNVGECEAMLAAFGDAGVPLFIAYYRRALPRFRRIKAWIDEGRIGRVRIAQIMLHKPASLGEGDGSTLPWRVMPSQSAGGYFVDLGCHTLDVLAWMLGPIEEVGGVAANHTGRYSAEDAVAASFRFADGALGSGVWAFHTAQRADTVAIVGDLGTIRFSTFGDEPVQLRTTAESTDELIAHPEHIQQPLIQSIVDELNGVGTCPSTGASAMQTTWAIDQILKGWRKQPVVTA
jgi:predicted dehydrogenase